MSICRESSNNNIDNNFSRIRTINDLLNKYNDDNLLNFNDFLFKNNNDNNENYQNDNNHQTNKHDQNDNKQMNYKVNILEYIFLKIINFRMKCMILKKKMVIYYFKIILIYIIEYFSSLDKKWENKFELLKKFKQKYGHCNVPSIKKKKKISKLNDQNSNIKDELSQWKSLSRWCYRQRLYKHSMPSYRIQKLEEIGFKFETNKNSSRLKEKEVTINIPSFCIKSVFNSSNYSNNMKNNITQQYTQQEQVKKI